VTTERRQKSSNYPKKKLGRALDSTKKIETKERLKKKKKKKKKKQKKNIQKMQGKGGTDRPSPNGVKYVRRGERKYKGGNERRTNRKGREALPVSFATKRVKGSDVGVVTHEITSFDLLRGRWRFSPPD